MLSYSFIYLVCMISYLSSRSICTADIGFCSLVDYYKKHLKITLSGSSCGDKVEYFHLAVVACGDRHSETLTMIKSLLLFNSGDIYLHIFADEDLKWKFENILQVWKNIPIYSFDFTVYPIQFPPEIEAEEWKNLFKPCASQRLFIHEILRHIDSLIYVDTDVLFLRPIEDLWRYFMKFNRTQIAGATAEHEEPQAGWYNRFALHPYVPPYGINSGVMLMNLTRIREKKLFKFTCGWNYRPDHCMYMSNCKDAEQHGVSILHGNRGTFHNDKMPTFKAVYDSFHELPIGNNSVMALKADMLERIKQHQESQCGKVFHLFTKYISI